MADGYRSGRREFQADFDGILSSDLSKDRRPDALSFSYLRAFSFGPYQQADPSRGLFNRAWYVRVDGNDVKLARQSENMAFWEPEVTLFSYLGAPIVEVDLAFEQNGRAVVCAERATGVGGASEVWIYWFDPFLANFTFENFGSGRTPRAVLDYPPDSSISDVLVFYFKDGDGLIYRVQRERYDIANATPVTQDENRYLEELAFMDNWRIAAFYSIHQPATGRYTLHRLETTMYPVPLSKEALNVGTELIVALLDVSAINHTLDEDEVEILTSLVLGELREPVIQHSLFDIEKFKVVTAFQSGSVIVVVIQPESFDPSEFEILSGFVSGSIVLVVIEHSLYDIEELSVATAFQSGSLAA